MSDAGFPCFYCGAAYTCKHRTIERPTVEIPPPPPRNGGNFGGGQYRLPRGAYAGLAFRTRKFRRK